LAVGDITTAAAWADQHHGGETESLLNRHIERLGVARVRLAAAASNDELDQALGLLAELASCARDHRWNGLLIETLLLLAKAKLRRSGSQEALGAMDEAVRLAQAGGFFQTIVDEGAQAAELLRAGLEAGNWTPPPLHAYVQRVLGALGYPSP
jgi:hypothetical protein